MKCLIGNAIWLVTIDVSAPEIPLVQVSMTMTMAMK